MAEAVRFEVLGVTGRIVIDRPAVKNALNIDAVKGLLAALERARADPAVRVITVEGNGGDFSSGGDIQDMVARRGQAVATYDRIRRGLTDVVLGVTRFDRPVLALVDGVCLGAGAGLALSCDAILATRRAKFGFPFVKVGLVPDTAISWLLPHIVGVQNARRLLLTGETVDAEEAAGLGLVTRVVPDAAALKAETQAWAEHFQALPATALRDVKRILWANVGTSLDNAIVHEAIMQGVRFTTDEHARAADAFLAKRTSK